VNQNNFLIWDDGTGETGLGPLAYAYWQDRDRCTTAIVAVPGETMSFYLNAEEGLALGTFGSLKLELVNSVSGVVVNNNVAPLSQHIIEGANYNVYASFVFPAAVKGLYHFEITGGTNTLTSNHFTVRNTDYVNQTIYARFRHDRYFYGLPYAFDDTFYQRFRLNASLVDEQPETDREVYKEQTTGKRRVFKTDMDWIEKIETYYFSPDDHKAAAVLFEHDEIRLNDEDYVTKATYRINTERRSKISKGEVELFNQTFASLNRCIN
jgi:hypothetical protein